MLKSETVVRREMVDLPAISGGGPPGKRRGYSLLPVADAQRLCAALNTLRDIFGGSRWDVRLGGPLEDPHTLKFFQPLVVNGEQLAVDVTESFPFAGRLQG